VPILVGVSFATERQGEAELARFFSTSRRPPS